MANCLKRIFLMMSFAVVLALANFYANPARPPWNPEADLPKGEVHYASLEQSQNSYLWVDARQEAEFAHGHYPDAINLNQDNWDSMIIEVLDKWQPSFKTIVYCSSRACDSSHAVAERLRSEMGLTDVFVLHGGWESLILEMGQIKD